MRPVGHHSNNGDSLRYELSVLPNQQSAIRLLIIPFLWIFALMALELTLWAGLLVALLTYALDGMSARRLKLTSDFCSAFDSLADNLLAPSAMVWLLVHRPQIFTRK
jgi:phosphatidylglycerophosphate synthase